MRSTRRAVPVKGTGPPFSLGSLLSFQVGADDGEVLADQLGGDIEANDVMSLPKYTAYVRLLVDGLAQRPFSMETITPPTKQDTAEQKSSASNHVTDTETTSAKWKRRLNGCSRIAITVPHRPRCRPGDADKKPRYGFGGGAARLYFFVTRISVGWSHRSGCNRRSAAKIDRNGEAG
jgi:hypothetical protein